jgi:N-acetylmuramoyl-L-alanine amidase
MNYFDPCVGIAFIVGQMMLVIAPQEVELESVARAVAWQTPTVVIDAGHGGRDAGAHRNGLAEKDLALDLAVRLRENLQRIGFPVVMTRTDDRYVALSERADVANALDDALFVSLHFNTSPGIGPAGIETYYAQEKVRPSPLSRIGFFPYTDRRPDPEGEDLAALVHTALHLQTGSPDRGIRARQFYVLRHTRCPAILVEAGFINNTFEASLLATPAYRQRIADAVAVGVAAYYRGRQERLPAPGPLAESRPPEAISGAPIFGLNL